MSRRESEIRSLSETKGIIDRFDVRVDQAMAASPPTKEWVGKALRHEGAPRCPVHLRSLSYDVILRHGDALADLFCAYPDDLVLNEPYPWFVGYSVPGAELIDPVQVLTEQATWTDEWGARWEHAADGVGPRPIGPVLTDWSQLDDYLAHRIPDAAAPGRLDGALPALEIHGATRYFIGMTGNAFYERLYNSLRGMENTLEDLYSSPREIDRVLGALTDYDLEIIRAWARFPNVDAHLTSDDWGSQRALMISPQMWRRVFAPRYRRLFDEAHRCGLTIAMHSCGHVLPIIGDLIDAGLDIIHPLQPEAMDLRLVAREYGGKVAFWGGLSDQAIALYSPTQVRDEVRRTIDILGAPFGNAYIVSLSNVLMPEVPFANIEALFQACHEQ